MNLTEVVMKLSTYASAPSATVPPFSCLQAAFRRTRRIEPQRFEVILDAH